MRLIVVLRGMLTFGCHGENNANVEVDLIRSSGIFLRKRG